MPTKKKLNCNCGNYETDHKGNYERHKLHCHRKEHYLFQLLSEITINNSSFIIDQRTLLEPSEMKSMSTSKIVANTVVADVRNIVPKGLP